MATYTKAGAVAHGGTAAASGAKNRLAKTNPHGHRHRQPGASARGDAGAAFQVKRVLDAQQGVSR